MLLVGMAAYAYYCTLHRSAYYYYYYCQIREIGSLEGGVIVYVLLETSPKYG